MASTEPYRGSKRKLVLAFDVGTTFSGVGYAILDPGEVPKIQGVTRFPGQENGDFKIPSVLWYTQQGRVRAAGAEAFDPAMHLIAEATNLTFVEWFKLHLRPRSMESQATLQELDLRPLPPGKTVVDVFGDFLGYLFSCAKRYIIESHPNGDSLWRSVEDELEVVLSHPNGWEGAQQGKMRQAAINAGIVPDSPAGKARVHFVTEGEASVQYCVGLGLASGTTRNGSTVMMVDAGGGTVDISTYCFTSVSPMTLEEIAPIDCLLQGSTRVNLRTEQLLQSKLANSKYNGEEDIKCMLESFERSTKLTFRDSADRAFIKFGTIRDHEPSAGIIRGQLTLEGFEVADMFEPSIIAIVDAIKEQRRMASKTVSTVFLVGGFAASPWLFNQLKSRLSPLGVSLSRPDNHTNKAVAEGAVSFYLEHFVSARVARWTYGAPTWTVYDPENPEHVKRSATKYTRDTGIVALPNSFDPMLKKGTRVTEDKEIRLNLFQDGIRPSDLSTTSSSITVYRGKEANPLWRDAEPHNFVTLCTCRADTSKVTKAEATGEKGKYYKQVYDLVLLVGRTEMKAQIAWFDNGQEKRGPAELVYDDAA